ncbi:MAG: hypothetical protein L3J46_00795 [Kangiellaceae bacterium]|nr:hypothetical protein [Kangiellaceae bacterium]
MDYVSLAIFIFMMLLFVGYVLEKIESTIGIIKRKYRLYINKKRGLGVIHELGLSDDDTDISPYIDEGER